MLCVSLFSVFFQAQPPLHHHQPPLSLNLCSPRFTRVQTLLSRHLFSLSFIVMLVWYCIEQESVDVISFKISQALFELYVIYSIIKSEWWQLHIQYSSKVWGQSFLREINTFIQQGCIKLIKNDSKEIYNVTKYFYFKNCYSFELHIHQRIQKNKCSLGEHKWIPSKIFKKSTPKFSMVIYCK